jgi:hypothetical protein
MQDESDDAPTIIREEDYGDMNLSETPEVDDVDDSLMDKYLNAELIFDVGTGNERKGRVVKRAKGTSGEPIGRAHANPLFDTREYVVEFTDGSRKITSRMSSPSACMHKLTLKGTNINSSMR